MISLTDTLARIRSGSLTPAEAIAAARHAIAEREPAVGAFAFLPEAPRPGQGPLAGVAVAVKDIVDTADMPTGMGAAIYEGWRPKADAAIVTALRRAGATVIGKSTTTAFASADPTATRNPHSSGHTPGGSSAGSAAAVGAGMVPLAVGTQTGGSVIRPASFCGVAAIKPSFRLIPTVGVKTLAWTLDTLGLFAATVPDLAVALAAVAGRPMSEGRTVPPRFGIVRQDFARGADPDGEAALEEAAERLSRAGASLVDLLPPTSIAEAWAAHPTLQDYEAAASLSWEYDAEYDRIPPKIRASLDTGRGISATDYDEARRIANRGRRDAKDLFRDIDAAITYSAPGAAPAGLGSTGDARLNRVWTMLGTPCVNVPGLTGRDGLPVGIQVVAPFSRDALALDAAAFVETVLAA